MMRGLLSALWSFLQHPAATFGDHLTALEARLSALETRLVGDLKTVLETGVVAVEDTVAGAEHRVEDDFKRTLKSRLAAIQVRLDTVKSRVIEDLKAELRRVALILALIVGCIGLALVGTIFGLMAAWTALTSFIGSVAASFVMAIIFLLASAAVFVLLRSTLHPSPHPHNTGKTAN